MKRIFILFALITSASMFSQEVEQKPASKLGYYTSVGLSITNTADSDFKHTAYPSVEVGVTKDNLSVGLVMGRSNLADFGVEFKGDNISNYWYEAKTAVSQPIGAASGYMLFGVGNYINTQKIFIEYGVGITYTPKKVGYFIQASNWDTIWYNSIGVSFNL